MKMKIFCTIFLIGIICISFFGIRALVKNCPNCNNNNQEIEESKLSVQVNYARFGSQPDTNWEFNWEFTDKELENNIQVVSVDLTMKYTYKNPDEKITQIAIEGDEGFLVVIPDTTLYRIYDFTFKFYWEDQLIENVYVKHKTMSQRYIYFESYAQALIKFDMQFPLIEETESP